MAAMPYTFVDFQSLALRYVAHTDFSRIGIHNVFSLKQQKIWNFLLRRVVDNNTVTENRILKHTTKGWLQSHPVL